MKLNPDGLVVTTTYALLLLALETLPSRRTSPTWRSRLASLKNH